MSKELIVATGRHETRVAILEDDQLVEVFHEREKEYSLAGSIHKGRVTRVLPGMQSAFVDIGLERDAFLYVSDFFEDNDEYDAVVSTAEEKVLKLDKAQTGPVVLAEPEGNQPIIATTTPIERPQPRFRVSHPAKTETRTGMLRDAVDAVDAAAAVVCPVASPNRSTSRRVANETQNGIRRPACRRQSTPRENTSVETSTAPKSPKSSNDLYCPVNPWPNTPDLRKVWQPVQPTSKPLSLPSPLKTSCRE